MRVVATSHELITLDALGPWPTTPREDERSREDRVVRALRRIASISKSTFEPEGPSDFQDGPAFMCAQEYERKTHYGKFGILGGYYFSKFGELFTGGKADPKSRIDESTWEKMSEVIAADYGFLFVPPSLLAQEYSGPLDRRYKCTTWWDRYFAAWYG